MGSIKKRYSCELNDLFETPQRKYHSSKPVLTAHTGTSIQKR